MRALALPIRIGQDGRLERSEPLSALLRLMEAMAATSTRHWEHAPWFGLQELFVGANLDLQDQPQLVTALNRALSELGVDWARVDAVRTDRKAGEGERRFDIVLASFDGRVDHGG